MEHEWLFLLIPLVIGVTFLCIGAHGLRLARALRRTGTTAAGRVVGHDTRRDDDGATYHHPVVAWTARDGREYAYPSRLGRSPARRLGVGTSITVRYDEENPRRFEIQGWDSTTVPAVFTVVGAVLTTGTLSLLLLLITV
ncbi:DUF3592 domain-containing protein [Streptomyces sp. NPDC057101]|uniref:DUF3592 domain-containing protein n=1 Tax=Streptomyces sp. NPDC057101 TaxID=3346020 RepID=UPI00363C4167